MSTSKKKHKEESLVLEIVHMQYCLNNDPRSESKLRRSRQKINKTYFASKYTNGFAFFAKENLPLTILNLFGRPDHQMPLFTRQVI